MKAFNSAELRFHINCTVDSLEANYDSYVSANKDVRQLKALDISRACIFITQEKFRGLTLVAEDTSAILVDTSSIYW